MTSKIEMGKVIKVIGKHVVVEVGESVMTLYCARPNFYRNCIGKAVRIIADHDGYDWFYELA